MHIFLHKQLSYFKIFIRDVNVKILNGNTFYRDELQDPTLEGEHSDCEGVTLPRSAL